MHLMATNSLDQTSRSAGRVLVAFNPTAGAKSRGALVDRLVAELGDQGFTAQRVESLAALSEETHLWLERGELRAVVAAGGDGTVAEIANRTPPGTPIAVLPLGTENLLARHLGLGSSVEATVQLLAYGHTIRLDAGRAGHRLFLLMVGAGFDGEVVRLVHSGRNGNIRHWSYARPIWQAIRRYKFPQMRVRYLLDVEKPHAENSPGPAVDGPLPAAAWSEPHHCRWAFVFNLPCYARGLRIAPAADGRDGLLDVCTFERGGVWAGLRYLSAVALGSHARLAECSTVRCRGVRIESDESVPYEIDGDPGGMLPVEIEIVPERLCLLAPAHFLSTASKAAPSGAITGGVCTSTAT